MSLTPWQLRSPPPFLDSLTMGQWIWARSTKNNGRVFRSVRFQSVSGVGADVSNNTTTSTFPGSNVFWPVRWRQLRNWAVSGQVLRLSFPHEMYLIVSLIRWRYKFCFPPCRLSPSVLQGFTCSSVQRMSRRRIRQMVRACRPRRRRAKVELKESQVKLSRACLKIDF